MQFLKIFFTVCIYIYIYNLSYTLLHGPTGLAGGELNKTPVTSGNDDATNDKKSDDVESEGTLFEKEMSTAFTGPVFGGVSFTKKCDVVFLRVRQLLKRKTIMCFSTKFNSRHIFSTRSITV